MVVGACHGILLVRVLFANISKGELGDVTSWRSTKLDSHVGRIVVDCARRAEDGDFADLEIICG